MTIEATATLLERERELSELRGALADAEERRGRMVLVEAPAGLGKTSLLNAAWELAGEAGFRCLRARASDLERDFAYGLVRQLLEPVVADASDEGRAELFDGAASFARRLFAPIGPPGGPPPLADNAFAMLHGLYWLINNLAAAGPVALFVDDLHWSDAESLRLLSYLGPRIDGLCVAVFSTTRPGEGDVAGLTRFAGAPETALVRPGPLSTEATAELCERRLGAEVAPEFAAACRDATGGNPFFLEELLREASERGFATDAGEAERVRAIGPASVARTVLLRLSGKPPEATALVRAVAVLGDNASLTEAAAVAGISEDEAAEAADLLATLGILHGGETLQFAHAIVRAAVREDMGTRARALAHAHAAEVLAGLGAPAQRVAAQIVAADPAGDSERVALLREVAEDALTRGAPGAAVAWLTRALAEPPPEEKRLAVLLELGGAELRLGTPAAIEHLSAAVEAIDEPEPLAMATRQLALALSISGSSDEAVRAIESTIDRLEPDEPELALVLEAELASHAQQASVGTRAPAARRLERHGELAGRTRGERLVLASRAYEYARASPTEAEAARYLEAALGDGGLLRDLQLDIAGPFYDVVVGLLATDSLDVAEAAVDKALSEARARGSIPAVAFVTDRRGWIALRRGAVAKAECDARTGLELLTTHRIPLGVPFALGLLIRALIEMGEADAAERELRESGVDERVRPGLTNNFLIESIALLHLAQGRTGEGLDGLLEFGRLDESWGGANPLASRWRSDAALALASLGEMEAARRAAADDLERARQWGAPTGIGVALRAGALVEGGEAAISRLGEAVEMLEQSPARLEHARALTDFGAALRRANRRADAQQALEPALRAAERLGARALADRARTELRAAGGRSSDPDGTGVEQLTASEVRVAELAAQGLSNPEIAQALFVTRKTVETHLGHVYAKLGIAGRGELDGVLDGSGSGAGSGT